MPHDPINYFQTSMSNQLVLLSLTPDELRQLIFEAVAQVIDRSLPLPIDSSNKAVTQDDLLSREETAKLLRVSLPTLRNFELRGELKPRRIGRRVLYSRSDILNAGLAR
jgi:hypothetical protein